VTYTTMKDLVSAAIGDPGNNDVPQAVIFEWIKEAELLLMEHILALPKIKWDDYLHELSTETTFSGDASTVDFSLPNDYEADYAVTLDSVKAVKVDRDYARKIDANEFFTSDANTPLYYIAEGYITFLHAPATGTNNIVVSYIGSPSTAGTSSELPTRLHQLIVDYAVERLKEGGSIDLWFKRVKELIV